MPDQPGAGRDVIQSGRERSPHRTPSPQLLALLALVELVVAVVTVHAVTRRGGTRGPRGPVQVTGVGHRLLGVRAGWGLVGIGPRQGVRIPLARARLPRTPVPGLQSSRPVRPPPRPHHATLPPPDHIPA